MSKRIFLSVSILSMAVLAGGCSRNRSASASPAPNRTASADRAATEAGERESAKLRDEADRATAAERLAGERAAGNRELAKATITTPVHFEFDRSEITEEGIRLLDQKVEALQNNPSIRIRVEGNADDNGSDEYNMVLSQRRAAIVNRYFTERGIDASRIHIVSYGEEHPVCTDRDEGCRSRNRRDEFVILSGL
ncbi:MAG: OmpA family protein [Gemmatimonadota bacterium]|nr:OmpA family protein [Gemmatimonadota bacterium]